MPTPPDPNTPQPQPSQPSSPAGGGFMSKIGSFLKQNSGAIADIGNQLAAAGGNYAPLQIAHQAKVDALQQQLGQSQLENQRLSRAAMQQQVDNYQTPAQQDARSLANAGALEKQRNALAPPTDVVAPMPEGGMGHYNRSYNAETGQWDTKPTMIQGAAVPNPTQAMTMPPTTGTNTVGPQQAPTPAIPGPVGGMPLVRPSTTSTPQTQLPAMTKPVSTGGDVEPDENSYTGFSRVWRGPGFQEMYRTPAPAPSAYVGSTSSGSNTVLKDDGQGGQVAVALPHSTTKTPQLPKAGGPPPKTMPSTGGSAGGPAPNTGGVRVSAPVLNSKPNADEQRRADLAENLNENLNNLEEIAKRRPDLFGPPQVSGPGGPGLGGYGTAIKQFFGSNDPDVGALETIKHQIGMAQISAHGMRSAQGIASAADSIMNGFKNGAPALLGSINAARESVKTFGSDVRNNRPLLNQPRQQLQQAPPPASGGQKVIQYDANGNRVQ